jgi:hypothetical protein
MSGGTATSEAAPAGRAHVPARVGMFAPFGLAEQGPETARTFLAQAGEAGINHICCGDHISFAAGLGSTGSCRPTGRH